MAKTRITKSKIQAEIKAKGYTLPHGYEIRKKKSKKR